MSCKGSADRQSKLVQSERDVRTVGSGAIRCGHTLTCDALLRACLLLMRQFERRVSTVRLGIDGSVLNRHFAVAGGLSRAANNVATRTPDPTHLNLVAEAAEAGIGNLLRSLPPWRRDGLAVEAGVVKTTLEGSEAVVSDERDMCSLSQVARLSASGR